MKIFVFLAAVLCISTVPITAQTNINQVLSEIEQNNTVLSTLKKQAEAEKIGNKTGIYLENPEVEFHYLWGNNSGVGNRTDISATQSFDFPTAYHLKRKIADGKNLREDYKYLIQRKDVLLEARQTCIQLIYFNMFFLELEKRLQHAKQIAGAYQFKYNKGEVNILDLNKAQLNLLNVQKEINILETDKGLLMSELVRLNGGKAISLTSSTYDSELLPADFEQWYAEIRKSNAILQYLQQETTISKSGEKLQRSMNLPKFSAGYMSEKAINEQFQGVTVGISVPLWENKNTVKKMKAQTLAHEAAENDADIRFYNTQKALYEKAMKLQQISSDYKKNMTAVNSSDLLRKALDAGEISLINYMLELGIYYEAVNNILETERDYQLTINEIKQWGL